MKITHRILALVLAVLMLVPIQALAAGNDPYTPLTKKTFKDVAAIIDGGEYDVYYYDGSTYTKVGYITRSNNENWYYIGASGSVSESNSYYNGRYDTYYYGGDSAKMNLYSAPADPDAGSQSFTIKATNLSGDQTLTAKVVNPTSNNEIKTVTLNSGNNWTAEVTGLGDGVEYTVTAEMTGFDTTIDKQVNTVPASWAQKGYGEVEAGKLYAFTYTANGTTYLLGGNGTSVVTKSLAGSIPTGAAESAYLWKAITAANGTSYGEWLLQNQASNGYLAPYNGYSTGYSNSAVLQPSDSYYGNVNLNLDDDGSIWNGRGSLNLYAQGSSVKSDSEYYTVFTPYAYQAPTEAVSYVITATKQAAPPPDTYTVTWKNGETVLETDQTVNAGTKLTYDGAAPTKDADSNNTYTFAGWSTDQNATTGTAVADLPAVTGDTTYYAVFTTNPKTLYVRLTGSFDSMVVGQQMNEGVDAVSGASTGGGSFYTNASIAVNLEYALADAGTARADVPEESWKKPDWPSGSWQILGNKSNAAITPGDSGMTAKLDPLTGGIELSGTAENAGTYKVSVTVTDNENRTATSNALDLKIYTGEEKLHDLLTYDNCTQTNDKKYIYDMEPWKIEAFGGENETVTVPKNVKAWYGSHYELPTVLYTELGVIAPRTSDGKVGEPTQTLIIPNGCNLTMVNMKIHSGVKIVVEDGGKLTLRQTTVDGIIEVENGGTFSMDYNDYGDGKWLHGSMINGQLRMKDGSTLENARITAHGNYLAETDNDARRNYEPVVVTEGNVTIKGDVYILGDEAPTGTEGQPGLEVKHGTLTVPAGSTLAVYGGGSSNLTAEGGDAIILDNGKIDGAGNLIAVGGYAMNITADQSKGNGGAAVSGTGEISVANAYLEGGSCDENTGTPSEALNGDVEIADTTNNKQVKGSATLGNTSPQYWHGTGDSKGPIPAVAETLALIPENAPAGVPSGKTSVSAKVVWTDEADHSGESVAVTVKDRDGKEDPITKTITKADNWAKTVAEDLDNAVSYIVEATSAKASKVEVSKDAQEDTWADGQTGNIEAGAVYLISYEDNGKTYILGAQDGNLGKAEWNGQTPKSVPDGFKWSPVFASNTYGWYLMNQDAEDQYLSMTGNPHKPTMYTKSGEYDYYYALKVDTDGSIWSNNYSQQFKISGENWSTVGTNSQDFTKFTFHKLVPSANEAYVITVTPNPAMVTTPPTANDLTESSSAQALVTAGTATGGTMQYALGGNADTAPATGWKEDIPTSADAGTYYVWYKAAGDDKHNDSAAACVEVTIAKRTAADPVASRGSSGGGTTTYTITVVSPDNGSAAASSKSAAKGQTVTVTPAPAEGYKLDKVTVTDKSGKEITVTENDGKYTFPMPASNVTVTPAFVKDGNVQPIPFGAEKFVDVPKDAWYHDAVYRAVDKDITQGTDETHFSPDATCTRAQMVTFLWRAAGEPEAASAENPFTDVTESAYYHDAVLWGVDQGLVKGTSETTFSPDATVTRAQTVTFLYRYEQSQGGGFTGAWAFPLDYSDASDVPLWAYEPFCWMTMHNVVQGSNGKLLSNDKCLRSQIVTMLDRYFEE